MMDKQALDKDAEKKFFMDTFGYFLHRHDNVLMVDWKDFVTWINSVENFRINYDEDPDNPGTIKIELVGVQYKES
jgi:hypothetical protein